MTVDRASIMLPSPARVACSASASARQAFESSTLSPDHFVPLLWPSFAMASAYIFTLHPTFTQGLILGQLSILFLLFLILKYLFFDTETDKPYRKASYPPRVEPDSSDEDFAAARLDYEKLERSKRDGDSESSEWLNLLLQQVRLPSLSSSMRINMTVLGS